MSVWRSQPTSKVRRHHPRLSDTVAAVLLGGWDCDPPDGECDWEEMYDRLFGLSNAALARLWLEHARYLQKLARRWGWQPRWTPSNHAIVREWAAPDHPGPWMWFGEYLVASEAQRQQRMTVPPPLELADPDHPA